MWKIIISPSVYNQMRRSNDMSPLNTVLKELGAQEGDEITIMGDYRIKEGMVSINGRQHGLNSAL